MESLDYTQKATALIAGINDNLEEMGVDARVSTSMSASQLVNVMNGVFNDVDGTVELSTDDDAETFVGNLNLNFEAADEGGGGDTPVEPSEYSLPAYKSTVYGTASTGEMKSTLDDVKALTLDNGEFDDSNLVFVLSTDLHTDKSPEKRFEESATNQKKFIELATQNGVNVNNVVCLGDFTDGRRDFKSTLISYVSSNVINPLIKLGEVKPLLLTIGNHDNNVDSDGRYACLTRNEIYNLYFKDSDGEPLVDFDAVNSITVNGETFFHEYYKDFDTQKIRVVVLDCNPVNDTVQDGKVESTNERNNNTQKLWWFPPSSAQYLGRMFGVSYTGTELTDKSDMMPEDYKLIVLCHAHFQSINSDSNKTINMSRYVYDLLLANKDKVIAMMSGHRHKDIVSVSPVPAILTGCNKFENLVGTEVWEQTSVDAIQKYSKASRSTNNHTADLWDVVIINKNNNVINTIRFGAGYNRRLHTDYINIQVGDTYTLEPTIQSANGFTWNIQNCCYSSASYMDSTPYISVENGVVSILQANASYNRYLVWAANSEGTWREYWCIEVSPSNS